MNDLPMGISKARRRPISSDPASLVDFEPLTAGCQLPLVCRPRHSAVSLPLWAAQVADDLSRRLRVHGAILFRGFGVQDVAEFSSCVESISGSALEYKFRASPRTQVDARYSVYTSTDYPAPERIFPHNEHAYSAVFPLELYFFCDVASPTGGETPLGDLRSIQARIAAPVREEFARKGIMYVRNYGDGMGLSWQTVFQTDEPAAVERYCESVGIRCEWKPDNRLRTRQVGPAFLRHPLTGERLWFNHATFFNAATLPASLRAELLREFSEQDLPQNTFYGDGTAIPGDVIAHLQQAYLESMLQFAWQPGDVLWLDNMLTVHARNEYAGPRRILTAMARAQRNCDLTL